jgi:hypothetical protein
MALFSERSTHSDRPDRDHPLRDENGKPLEVKEGVVLDQDGNQLTDEPPRSFRNQGGRHHAYRDPFTGQRAFVFKTTNPLAPLLLAPLIVIALGVGLTLFTGVAVAAFVAWIVFMMFRTLRRL